MRRTLLLLTSLLSISASLHARESPLTAGLWAGIGSASSTDAKGRLSFGIGADVSLHGGRFALVARPALDRRGYRYGSGSSKLRVNTSYLDIPVLIEYGFTSGWDNSVFIGAGGYYGLAFAGNYRQGSGSKIKLNFGEDSTDNRSRQDMGFVLSAGYRLDGGAKAGVQLMFSTNDVIPDARQMPGQDEQRLSVFYFFVSIPFREFYRKK